MQFMTRRAVTDASVTNALASVQAIDCSALWTGGTILERRSLVLVRCRCGSQLCHKVLKVDSVRSADASRTARDPFTCPAHDATAYSPTREFVAALERMNFVGVCVWDWHCIPGRSKMHVDATLVNAAGIVRMFELDGSSHFQTRDNTRNDADEDKDDALNRAGIGLLRLHYMDSENWELYIQQFFSMCADCVMYTDFYSNILATDRQVIRIRQ